MEILRVKNVKKIYNAVFKRASHVALNEISFTMEKGEFTAIMGESGSGKTTLLNLISALDKPDSGEIYIEERDIIKLSSDEMADFRRENLGFVFQDFNLLDNFTVKDNILLPMVLSKEPVELMEKRLKELVVPLGIEELLNKYPFEISGGEKQRCASARALITEPKLLLADEPTGALDSKSAANLLEIFENINKKGQSILMVTHSVTAACHAGRVLFIKDGKIYNQIYKGERTKKEMYELISNTLTVMASRSDTNEEFVF